MKKTILKIFTFVFVLSFMVSPLIAQVMSAKAQSTPPPEFEPMARPEPQPVPQEILDMFEGGMTIEEFLDINQGPIPNAILDFADIPVTVVVQLDKPPLIEYLNQEGLARSDAGRQVDYVEQLKGDQAAVLAQIAPSRGGEVVQIGDAFTKTLNGFMLRLPAYAINEIRAIPGVKAVTQAPEYELNLHASTSLIGATEVWTDVTNSATGEGITIAVIDTGIDYTHAMLGGSGDPADYAGNDPTITTDITFPTAKVIGGYDFAGSNYDASETYGSPIPVPDPDPLDENGHGTHVASTAAGEYASWKGVAPDAKLYALKIFGVQGSTTLTLHAIEWAMDPEGLGHLAEPVDVINMSIGSDWGPADVNDPEYQAVENATSIGVVVVSSAGNNGDSAYTTGSPASADSAISVAASSTGYETLPYFLYDTTQRIYFTPGNRFDVAITADLVDVNTLTPEPGGLMCNADVADITGTPLTGQIALISRGTCSFAEKINNAEALGAVAAFIYNNAPGSFGMDTTGSTLPAGSITLADGEDLKLLTPLEITVDPDNIQMLEADPADTLADFSSRGPRGFDSKLKPEITAPGVSIFAADVGSGDKGVSMSGTSMASPHIAGVAALLAEAHPGWDPVHIKAAMMNTADDLYDPTGGVVPLQGAGRVDAYKAAKTKVVAYADPKLVSLSWGVIEITEDYSDTQTITLSNFSGFDIEYDVSTLFTSSDTGATLTPAVASVIVPAEGVASVEVTLDLTAEDLPIAFGPFEHEEYYGFVTFTSGADTLRVPFYFVPRPYTEITEVDAVTRFDAEDELGLLLLNQSGPVASNMDAYPVSLISPENPAVLDHGDLRYVGMDYLAPFIYPAFAMWDDVHDPLPYFNEIDLYIDADRDGAPETVNFNWNYYPLGYPDDNWWLVIQLDFSDGLFYPGSPYLIYADFNSGVQVWLLPPGWNYVTDTFDYFVFSYDYYFNEDFGGMSSFDITRPPLGLGFSDWEPDNDLFLHGVWINDWYGYSFSNTQGVMLLDYHGKPGMGQSYFWPLDPYFDYFYPVFGQ